MITRLVNDDNYIEFDLIFPHSSDVDVVVVVNGQSLIEIKTF